MRTKVILLALLLNTYVIVDSLAQEMPLVYEVENTGADCPEPLMPTISNLPSIDALPDPFMWADSSGRISTFSDWRCRRAEIAAEFQHYELGNKPAPPSNLEASFSDGQLTVVIIVDEDTLTLTAAISIPDGEGPFPAVIGVGFGATGSLPSDIFTSRNIATVNYLDGQIAPSFGGRLGDGAFFDLYPDVKRGRFIAWAWGVSRIIDALEKTPETNIDLTRLAVTGCSYAGKIALFSGAFDERIALTIAQEPGGGGDAAWRVTETLLGNRETLRNAIGNGWYHQDLYQFSGMPKKLPFDHHELMALVAPRALFVLGNPDMEWLAEESGHVACKAAHEVWKALGVPDRFGFSKVGGHGHCQLPDSQRPEVIVFVEKFLLGDETVNTEDIAISPYDPDLSRWITWDTPTLRASSIDIGNSEKVTAQFDLLENYPNPFNPVTTIDYYLKQENHVQLSVYDVTGKKIRTLINRRQTAGKQTFSFDGSELASGIYIYTLQVGKFVKSRKMLLLR